MNGKADRNEKRTIASPDTDRGDAGEGNNIRSYKIEDWVALCILWILAIIVFVQFFSRYVLNDSIAWTEEIARYLLIAVTLIGCVMAFRNNSHVKVEIIQRMLPEKYRRNALFLVEVLQISIVAVLAYHAFMMLPKMHRQRMTVVDLPMSYLYGIVTIALVLILLRKLQNLYHVSKKSRH